MASLSCSVTLDRPYFETLLRKAQFHTSGVDYSTPVNLPMVTIPKADYDGLLSSSREYANLRRNLYQGGVSNETLAILVSDTRSQVVNLDGAANSSISGTQNTDTTQTRIQQYPTEYGACSALSNESGDKQGDYDGHPIRYLGGTSGHFEYNEQFDDVSSPNDGQDVYFNNNSSRVGVGRNGQFLRNAKRTIHLNNLPEAVTHADITEAIKGGMLLDIFLRAQDRAVSVSFLDENDAANFYRYAKRNDIYIRGKRVAIFWADRHFTLPNHVAYKIGMGATRNIVIRSASSRHTEESIRNDMDHIHNLVVVSVKFIGEDAYVSTNSVHNAMFARTCMMSRSKYKGFRIEWGADECNSPIPALKPLRVQKENIPPKQAKLPINRFAILNMDGAMDDTSSDEDSENLLGFQSDLLTGMNGVAV